MIHSSLHYRGRRCCIKKEGKYASPLQVVLHPSPASPQAKETHLYMKSNYIAEIFRQVKIFTKPWSVTVVLRWKIRFCRLVVAEDTPTLRWCLAFLEGFLLEADCSVVWMLHIPLNCYARKGSYIYFASLSVVQFVWVRFCGMRLLWKPTEYVTFERNCKLRYTEAVGRNLTYQCWEARYQQEWRKVR